MPRVSEMRESKFLKQSDVGGGILVTITGCEQHNVAMQGADPEMKWCLTFQEVEKPLVLNGINAQLCEKVCNSDNSDDWVGHKIVLYTDPNVAFGGKIVGGIRVRAPKVAKPAAVQAPRLKPAPVAAVETDLVEDDIPF
jgi:hypothetical protein